MTLALPRRPGKPRRRGLTAMIDFGPDTFGWTGEAGVRDLVESVGAYIDFAKIYALNALLLPHAPLRRTVRLYRDAEILPYAGGILFEYAWRRGEVGELPGLLRALDIPALEISENYITLTAEQRREQIGRLRETGFEVIYEFGRKQPERPFVIEELTSLIDDVRGAGACHVIVEQSELDLLVAADADALARLTAAPWFDHVLIEADPYRFPQQHASLIETLGPEVNLANIAPGQCLRLEGLRLGIGRAVNYAILEKEQTGR